MFSALKLAFRAEYLFVRIQLQGNFNMVAELSESNTHLKYSATRNGICIRGIEWSLRAIASMRALRLFLRARAMIKCVLRAASTFLNTTGEK